MSIFNYNQTDIINYINTNGTKKIYEQNFHPADIDIIINNLETTANYDIKEIRTDQKDFRKKLIDRYKKCVVRGSHHERCQAAHIIPYAECNGTQKYNIDNGLLLDAGLHQMFDSYLISINPKTLCLEINKQMCNEDIELKKLNGCKININKESVKYLKLHYQKFMKFMSI